MTGLVQSDWYSAAYMGDAGADNPFGIESRTERRNAALHEFTRLGGRLSDYARVRAETIHDPHAAISTPGSLK